MKHKTHELEGAFLDQAVAKSLCLEHETQVDRVTRGGIGFFSVCMAVVDGGLRMFFPSSDWRDGGPIIERERIALVCVRPRNDSNDGQYWDAYFDAGYTGPDGQVDSRDNRATQPMEGPTPLIAAMRALVAAKLGEEVELP